MKWLFLLVLLVNIAIFAWGYQRESGMEEASRVVVPAGVGNIRLLSERAPGEMVPDVNAGKAPLVVEEDGQPELPPGSDDEEVAPLPEPSAVADVETALDSVEEAPVEAEVVAAVDASDTTEAEAGEEGSEPVVQEPKSLPYCGVLGPLDDEEAAKSITAKLERLAFNPLMREQSMIRTTGYWVLIPPAKDQEAAIEHVNALKAKGFKDVRRFFQGPLKNAVSLGVFSRRGNASNRQKEVEAKGFKVEIKPRVSESILYWIDIFLEEGGAGRVTSVLQEEYPDLALRDQICSRVVRP
ncbi:MAG: SPOR domain-containing protein [Sedimenticola sp.]